MGNDKVIQFDLLKNAKDSIRHVVELLAFKDIGSDHSRLKHAITGTANCVELLLKERLRRVRDELIFQKENEFLSADAHTVNVRTAIDRLKRHGHVILSDVDKQNLCSLLEARNGIVHYKWSAPEKQAREMVGNALSFAFGFAQEELQVDLTTRFKDDDTWAMLLNEISEFRSSYGARLENRFRIKGEHPQCCDDCGELTVPISGGTCELCGHSQSIDEDDSPVG